jgi:murein DD-endopeptidase MepM/ murein hydrolase activator NlpD
MSDAETIAAVQAYLNRGFELMNEATAQFQHAAAVWAGMGGDGAKPEKLVKCSPVTGVPSTTGNVWGMDWYDATGYATYYTPNNVPCYHTGCDLNRPNFADSGSSVYACADGEIVFSGTVPGWQGQVVVIRHVDADEILWTRYAHIRDVPTIGMVKVPVKRGDKIGVIADYTPVGSKAGDHLHFDVCRRDLGASPGDWPGLGLVQLKRDYLNPAEWMKA